MNINNRYRLVAKINGLATQNKRVRILIKKAKKKDDCGWHYLRPTQRILGVDARHHLLAYGVLRGTPYRLIEPKCREDNQPSAEEILKIIEGHENRYTFINLWNLDKIKSWLTDKTVKPIPQPIRPKRMAEFIAILRKKKLWL